MSNQFKVSVIIPVYNAAEFLTEAVESAVNQDEVKEVLLIEDGSRDGSLEVCKQLSDNEKIKLYQHKGGINKGAGASRNLGIKKAECEYIAFLDADDIYLEKRFRKDKEIFQSKKDAEGVYSGVGAIFHDDIKEKFERFLESKLTTLSKKVPPDELLDVLLGVHPSAKGHFHLNGLTLKKEAVKKVGYQNSKLRLHQDTEWSYRLAFFTKLYPAKIKKPVSLRRVHTGNRYINNNRHYFTRFLMYSEIIRSSSFSDYPAYARRIFMRRCLYSFKNYLSVRTLSKLPYTFYKFILSYF